MNLTRTDWRCWFIACAVRRMNRREKRCLCLLRAGRAMCLPGARRKSSWPSDRVAGLFNQRQTEYEGGTTIGRAGGFDLAVGLLDQVAHDTQPESGTFAGCLGGVEGLEYPREHAVAHAAAIVDQLDRGDALIRVAIHRNGENTPVFHGVACISCDIEHHQLKLASVHAHAQCTRGGILDAQANAATE